jgi:hypothetical protein
MNIRKIIRRRVRHRGKGTDLAADIHAALAVNLGQGRSHSSVRSRQQIVRRPERDEEHPDRTGKGGD